MDMCGSISVVGPGMDLAPSSFCEPAPHTTIRKIEITTERSFFITLILIRVYGDSFTPHLPRNSKSIPVYEKENRGAFGIVCLQYGLVAACRPASEQYIHSFPSPDTLVVNLFDRNSRIKLVPILPAKPTAALVKTRFAPRFA